MLCRQFGLVFVALLATIISTGRFASAEIKTYDLEIIVLGGPLDGETGSGSFTYDDSILFEGLYSYPDIGLMLEFTLFGQTFTEADDIGYPLYPELTVFADTTPRTLDMEIPADNIDDPDITYIMFDLDFAELGQGLEDLGGGVYQAGVIVDVVPEPSTVALWSLCGLFGLGWWVRKRRKAA